MTPAREGDGHPMRILVVNWLDRENPQAGGAEEHLHEVFGRLAEKGHAVVALVSGFEGCERTVTLDGIEVHRAGGRYSFSFAGPRYYRKHLSNRDFDVVVEDLNKVPVFSPYWVRAPVVLLAHHLFGATAFQAGPPPVALATCILERAVPTVFRRRPVVAVSESTREDLVKRGLAGGDIEVIPNGIDLTYYTPHSEGVRTDRPSLLFLGRLKRYKRVDLIIEAVSRLANQGSEVELFVGGTGDQLEALQSLARKRGVAERVHFLGFVANERKLQLLRTSWLHVLTSPKEGWGISNLEAAACGTPTVASDAPGLRESVVDGETGILVPHGDVERLTDAIGSLLQDAERRDLMGRNARSFAERFSWDASAADFEALLHRVVAGSRPE
ncbi:MAG: glycosyltransferase family 4 protein [Gemmatimonadetes bacterium]|nr:glycosyltransferase family 4 protein [Gemmatimonadota bacterium]MDA1104722.1 glycosyltransferase family 4 protein [Gemmatimonadota bacterium]